MGIPKIFISYSWSNPDHEDWVVSLATRLVNNGVDTVLDKWHLKEGQDKFVFMESMVQAADISKVLVICDKVYAEKANGRAGGVGTETQIISPQVYKNVQQEKFIPIVCELAADGRPYLPSFLEGRIYIDFSSQDQFEASYEKLLRNLFNRPSLTMPSLGEPPAYLFEPTVQFSEAKTLVLGMQAKIDRSPSRLNQLAREFLQTLYNEIAQNKLGSYSTNNYGEKFLGNIHTVTPLRDTYLDFLKLVTGYEKDFDSGVIISFFEKLPALGYPQDGRSGWTDQEFENFAFISHELFLYTIAVFLKFDNWRLLEEMFHSSYFINDRFKPSNEAETFIYFNKTAGSFGDHYRQLVGKNLHSPAADLMLSRLPEFITKTDFVHADLLCHYIARLDDHYWFPSTYVYKDEYDGFFPFLNRLVSAKHFEKVKGVFNVTNVDDLRNKLRVNETKSSSVIRYSGAWHGVPDIKKFISADKFATLR